MTPAYDRSRPPNPLAPILDAAEALVSSLDFDEALARMTSVIGDALQVSKVDIYTYDRERDVLIYEARWVGDDLDPGIEERRRVGAHVDVRERPSWRPILEGEIAEWHINDPDLPDEERGIYERAQQMTTLDAPLVTGDTVIGVIGLVQRDRVRRFTPLERDLFEHLSRLAAIGIRNAQIVRHDAACHDLHEALIDAGRVVTAGSERETTLQKLAAIAADVLGMDAVTIYEYDADGDTLVCRVRHPISTSLKARDKPGAAVPLAERPCKRTALLSSQTRIAVADDPDLDETHKELLAELGAVQCVVSPIRDAGRPVGVVQLCGVQEKTSLGAVELAFLEGLTTHVAVALRAG